MRLRFLCQNHRNWLASDSSAARDSWGRNSILAQRFLKEGDHVKAVNYAGSAFEVAELLIVEHARHFSVDIERFSDSAALLCRSLVRVGQSGQVRGVIRGAVGRLDQLLMCGVERKIVLAGVERLLAWYEKLGLSEFECGVRPPERVATIESQRTLH